MRIAGVSPGKAGLFTRLWFRLIRHGTGSVTGKALLPDPARITAHQPALALGTTFMEIGQTRMSSVPMRWKALASYAAARWIGCPF